MDWHNMFVFLACVFGVLAIGSAISWVAVYENDEDTRSIRDKFASFVFLMLVFGVIAALGVGK